MAIVRALDGTFYEVPDEQLGKFKIPEDKLKEKLGAEAGSEPPPPEGGPGGGAGPLVNVQIYYGGQGAGPTGAPAGAEGAVQPYDYWRNWRNWNNWRNWHNWHNWRNHYD
jgi:hypothetical protein